MSQPGALGLSVFAGRAVVVVVSGTRAEPVIAMRHWLELGDPWLPESFHPYHCELGDGSEDARAARSRGCAAAEASARRAIANLLKEMRAHALEPRGAMLIVESLADPARVRGAHPRAHAAERQLYREAVAAELARGAVPTAVLRADEVRAAARARLKRSPRELHAVLREFSHAVGTPWRAPEKTSALGAWMALR